MRFEVEISELAEEQYSNILNYLANKLENPQAVGNVADDYDHLIELLEDRADSFGFCKSTRLRAMGFHKIPFENHRYVAVYRIRNSKVIIEGVYHELQDYENAIG